MCVEWHAQWACLGWNDFAQDAKDAKADKQHGAVVSARTAIAKLAGLWVDQSVNMNANYAISDKPMMRAAVESFLLFAVKATCGVCAFNLTWAAAEQPEHST